MHIVHLWLHVLYIHDKSTKIDTQMFLSVYKGSPYVTQLEEIHWIIIHELLILEDEIEMINLMPYFGK